MRCCCTNGPGMTYKRNIIIWYNMLDKLDLSIFCDMVAVGFDMTVFVCQVPNPVRDGHQSSELNAESSTLATACLRSSEWQRTLALLKESANASNESNESKASHLYRMIHSNRSGTNGTNLMNVMMSAWARGSHWLKSLAILRGWQNELQHTGRDRTEQMQPNTVSFNACLNALERSSKW